MERETIRERWGSLVVVALMDIRKHWDGNPLAPITLHLFRVSFVTPSPVQAQPGTWLNALDANTSGLN